jgi:hypothetical protein
VQNCQGCQSGCSGCAASAEITAAGRCVWLWPLPPAGPFEFAVEWPFGGIDLTFAEFDGAAVVAAAGRSARYWPETG